MMSAQPHWFASFRASSLIRLLAFTLLLAVGAPGFAAPASPEPGASSPASPAATTTPDSKPLRQVKTIGLIGGVSWVSSLEYYRIMNEMVRDTLGPPASAEVLMYSIAFADFAKQERLAEQGDWEPLRQTMLDAAARLKRGGADFIVIASNTMNSTAELIEEKIGIPVLHIADATGAKIKQSGIGAVALLGTKYTMEADFYRRHLEKGYGLKVMTPNAAERDVINTVIFDELVNGQFRPESRAQFLRIIDRMIREDGVQGVILGCTEIPLLIKQEDVRIPVFDTLKIHATAAVAYALSSPPGR